MGPLPPGEYYEFRLKVKTTSDESEWSDVLFALTKGKMGTNVKVEIKMKNFNMLSFLLDDVVSVAQFHRVVENGPVINLRKILGQRVSVVDVPNKYGFSSLRLATNKNNTNFMGILINHGADVGNTEKGSERTPLMAACGLGHIEAVQLLVEKGSSWNVRDRYEKLSLLFKFFFF